MTIGWVITWIETKESDLGIPKSELFMIHTYSKNYATKLIKYLELNYLPHEWCRVEGLNISFTGSVVTHFREKSNVIAEVFGK